MKTTRVRVKPLSILKERIYHLTGDVELVNEVKPPSGEPYKMFHVKFDRNPENITMIVLPETCFEIIGEIEA